MDCRVLSRETKTSVSFQETDVKFNHMIIKFVYISFTPVYFTIHVFSCNP